MNAIPILSTRPPAAILGVPFDQVTMAEALECVEAMIASRKPHYAATPNADFLVQARGDVELRRILCEADLVVCDGTPVLWSSNLLGVPLPERVAGSDLVPLLLRLAEAKQYRVFFLGASPEAGQQAAARLAKDYPALQLAGIYSPPFRSLLEMDHEDIRMRIQAAQPDILLVCFGCPKQEKWIAMHYQDLGVPISMGVGGTLDFLAGRLRRAPLWMRRAGLEWLFRLAQEPKRLVRRYVKDLGVFGWAIAEQIFVKYTSWRFSSRRSSSSNHDQPSAMALPPSFDRHSAPEVYAAGVADLSMNRRLSLDLSSVQSMDGVGVGTLLRLRAMARRNHCTLVLSRAPEGVRRLLTAHRVAHFFSYVDSVEALSASASPRTLAAPAQVRFDENRSMLVWTGEVTAANAHIFWKQSSEHLNSKKFSECVVDLAQVPFMDSSGLSVMVRLRQAATKHGTKAWFAHPSPQVSNVLRHARMESLVCSPVSSAIAERSHKAEPAHALS